MPFGSMLLLCKLPLSGSRESCLTCFGNPLFNGVPLLKVTFLRKKQEKNPTCGWEAKLNIQNEELNEFISPIKAILPCFAYVMVPQTHSCRIEPYSGFKISAAFLFWIFFTLSGDALHSHYNPNILFLTDQILHLILASLGLCCWSCKQFGLEQGTEQHDCSYFHEIVEKFSVPHILHTRAGCMCCLLSVLCCCPF